MEKLFKGYIPTKGKKAAVKEISPEYFKTYRQIRTNYDSYAGVLQDDIVLLDVDNKQNAELIKYILTETGKIGPYYHTRRGIHFYFKNPINTTSIANLTGNKTDYFSAIGLPVDIKIGLKTSYAVIKLTGQKRRFFNLDEEIQEFPAFLAPISKVRKSRLFDGKTEGFHPLNPENCSRQAETGNFNKSCQVDENGNHFDQSDSINTIDAENPPISLFGYFDKDSGRNSALFSHILTLQHAGMDVDSIKKTINIINKYVLKESLEQAEIDIILRDDAFKQNVFMVKGRFLFNEFATYFRREKHVIKLKGHLYIYEDGIYVRDTNAIKRAMHSLKDDLTLFNKREVLGYLEANIKDNSPLLRQSMIPFNNGLYDLETGELKPFAPEYITINKIPWDYKPDAYYEFTDKTLDKLAGGNKEIRLLLEEMIGYCFFRKNIYGKAFMLLGDKGNGKSTLLETIKDLLGNDNYKSLDLKELSNRFKSAELTDRLANIGDDIGDEFISDLSIFKKLVTGESINTERKGQDPFEFSNYAKLIFSANNLPRINDKSGSVLRRLVIIPFTCEFGPGNDDYNPNIKEDLVTVESMEYLARLGIEALHRVIDNKGFTENEHSKEELEEYAIINNPILDFFSTVEIEEYMNNTTEELYKKYKEHCVSNNYQPESKINFCRRTTKHFRIKIKPMRFDGKVVRIFTYA